MAAAATALFVMDEADDWPAAELLSPVAAGAGVMPLPVSDGDANV